MLKLVKVLCVIISSLSAEFDFLLMVLFLMKFSCIRLANLFFPWKERRAGYESFYEHVTISNAPHLARMLHSVCMNER